MLEQLLTANLFAVLMIFSRVGAGLMVMPGFGESYVNARARLFMALTLAVALAPMLAEHIPTLPAAPIALFLMLFAEVAVGLAIGITCRIMISTTHIAGMAISYQSGLAMATQFDASQASQGSIIGTLFGVTAVVLIFIMDLHHVMIKGLIDSYAIFAAGAMPPLDDFAQHITQLVSKVFTMGIRLAAPSIVVGLILYLGAGVLARIMPNVQIFFIIIPPQMFISFFVMLSVFAAILLSFTQFYGDTLREFVE